MNLNASTSKLLIFELVRDFSQLLSVVYRSGVSIRLSSNSFLTVLLNLSLGGLALQPFQMLDAQLAAFAPIFLVVYLFLTCCACCGFSCIRWCCRWDPAVGVAHDDVRSWRGKSRGGRVARRLLLLTVTSLYQPFIASLMRAATWSSSFGGGGGGDCNLVEGEAADALPLPPPLLVVGASLGALVWGLGLPLFLRHFASRNGPSLQRFDEHGRTQQYDVLKYQELLSVDQSPYKFLWSNYHYQHRHYQTNVMLFKFALTVVSELLGGGNCVAATPSVAMSSAAYALLFFFLLLYAIATYFTRPFLSQMAFRIELSSKLLLLVFCVIGFVFCAAHSFAFEVAVVLHLLLLLMSALIFCCCCCLSSDRFSRLYRRARGLVRLTEAPRRRERTDIERRSARWLVFTPNYDYDKAVNQELWTPWFDERLDAMDGGSGGVSGGGQERAKRQRQRLDFHGGSSFERVAPSLVNFTGLVSERHAENKRIASFIGIGRYREAAAAVSRDVEALRAVVEAADGGVAGVDVFEPRLKAFGHAEVRPFPFCIYFQSDLSRDKSSASVLESTDELRLLLKAQGDPETQRRRQIRTQLRAMHAREVFFQHTQRVTRTKQRQVQRRHADGSSYTTTESYTVHLTLHYERGTFRLSTRSNAYFDDLNVGVGFECAIVYCDGHGVDDEGTLYRSEPGQASSDDIGIRLNDYQMTSGLERLLGENRAVWEGRDGVERVRAARRRYRQHLADFNRRKRDTLSFEFHTRVYTHALMSEVSKERIVAGLRCERNRRVAELVESSSLRALLAAVERLATSTAAMRWFIVWNDYWRFNSPVFPALCRCARLLDPKSFDSIGFRPMRSADELRHFFEDAGLAPSRYLPQWFVSALIHEGGGGGSGGNLQETRSSRRQTESRSRRLTRRASGSVASLSRSRAPTAAAAPLDSAISNPLVVLPHTSPAIAHVCTVCNKAYPSEEDLRIHQSKRH